MHCIKILDYQIKLSSSSFRNRMRYLLKECGTKLQVALISVRVLWRWKIQMS